MTDFPAGTRSAFARAVSAEVRALLGAYRLSLRDFASAAGFSSHNYLAIRLRDEKPFTLDDIDLVCAYFEFDASEFLRRCYENHIERLWAEADLERSRGGLSAVDDNLGAAASTESAIEGSGEEGSI
ncbi:MAG TPA: hypothetical protein VGE38_08300 [Nocardioides sp.]|uniref:hypothetical protein n=1 Tax=Nocardioides sp. TaxID=35761 RepID=UPI002ED81916